MPDQDHRSRLPVQRRDQGVLVVGEGDAGAADRAAVSGEGDGLGGEAALGQRGDHAIPCRADMESTVQKQKTRDVWHRGGHVVGWPGVYQAARRGRPG